MIDFYLLAQVYSKEFRIYLFKYIPYLYKYICRYLFIQHCITFFTMTCNFPFSCVWVFFVFFFFLNVYESPHEVFTVISLSIWVFLSIKYIEVLAKFPLKLHIFYNLQGSECHHIFNKMTGWFSFNPWGALSPQILTWFFL